MSRARVSAPAAREQRINRLCKLTSSASFGLKFLQDFCRGDKAADRLRFGTGDGPAGDDCVERILQVMHGRASSRRPKVRMEIVDASAVTNVSALVDDHNS